MRRHKDTIAVWRERHSIRHRIRYRQLSDHLERPWLDLAHHAAAVAKDDALPDEPRRGINARTSVKLERKRHRIEVDHIEMAVARAAKQLVVGEQGGRVADVASLELGDLLTGRGLEDVDRAVEGGERDQPALLVDGRRILPRAAGVEYPHRLTARRSI